MMDKLLLLIFCHLIGDYFLQNDYIAKTKGDNWYHLFVHSVLYIVPFYLCFGVTWQLWYLLVSHFVVDGAKARYHTISYMQDQVWHYITLLTYLS